MEKYVMAMKHTWGEDCLIGLRRRDNRVLRKSWRSRVSYTGRGGSGDYRRNGKGTGRVRHYHWRQSELLASFRQGRTAVLEGLKSPSAERR